MSKICPNCKEIYYDDEEFICGSCGVNLVEMTEKPNPTLHLGDANAISGGVSINQSKNITSHDVHYHTVQERNKSEKELLQDRQNQYHDTVAKLLKGGVITVEARAQLDKLKFNLGLDDSIAANIEATVKNEQKTQARAGNDGLSVIGKMALKSAVAAVEENSPQVQSCIVKLAPVCKTTMNEQVHFYYSMLLAASDPQRCVEAYEKRTIDSYWLSYWASVAYRKLGNEMEAEGILTEMTGLWQERPEINVVINACLGIWLSCSGNLAECQETIIEYLTQTEEVPSEELNDLFHALLHAVGVEEEDNARYAFYNEHFLMVLNEEAELKKAQEAYDNKDYETALSIWNRLAERNNAVAIRKIGVCYCYGLGVPQDYAEAIRWNWKAVDLGNAVAMRNLGLYYENGQGVTQNYTEAVKWYQKAADLGDAPAMTSLGSAFMCGDGATKNPQEALKWWHKAADLGETGAYFNLGKCYYQGDGAAQDYAEAVKWYRKAADLGDARAMNSLGCCYIEGHGVTQDYAEAVKWYNKAADMGNANACCNLGRCYYWGEGATQDYNEAVKWYRKAAGFGNSEAMYCLGVCYENGYGITQNQTEAVEWYRKAADSGYVDAMFNLGNCYRDGLGVIVNYNEAVNWYSKAADSGDNGAMAELGNCYRDGQGVTQDVAEAVKWYRKAADLGNDYAMYELGFCYDNGEGVVQDVGEAVKWYRKAADLDNTDAMNNLGVCYYNGSGVTQDHAEAVKWYRKAADSGNVDAMFNLGTCYVNGDGVSADLAEALKWYRKAKEMGIDTEVEIQEIESKLKPTATTTHNCQKIPNLPKAAFEKAWVTQDNEQTIGVHYSLHIENQRGKVVSFKCVTRSLTPGSTFDKSTNVIHIHEEKSDALNWDDTRWDDWKYFLNESDIKNTLAFDYRNPYELETELSAYDSFNNCIGSYWIRYKVIHEARVIKGNRLLLSNQDNKSFNEQINEMITELEQLNNQIEKYKKNIEK